MVRRCVGIFIVYASLQSTVGVRIVPHGGSRLLAAEIFVTFVRVLRQIYELVSFSADSRHSRFRRDKGVFGTKITRKQENCVGIDRIDRIDETKRDETRRGLIRNLSNGVSMLSRIDPNMHSQYINSLNNFSERIIE